MRGVEVPEHADDSLSIDIAAEALPPLRFRHRDKSAPGIAVICAMGVVRQISMCGRHYPSALIADGDGARRTQGSDQQRAGKRHNTGGPHERLDMARVF